jgi:hypothetical protein
MALNHLMPLFKSCLVISNVEGSGLTLCHPNGESVNTLIEQKLHENVYRSFQGTYNNFHQEENPSCMLLKNFFVFLSPLNKESREFTKKGMKIFH